MATISILQTRALQHPRRTPEAFTLMRTYARNHNRPLSQIAKAVITHAPDIADLTISPIRPH